MAAKSKTQFLNNPSHVTLSGADLYHGDCLAVLPGLTGSFDTVVADPPYSSGGQSAGERARPTGKKYLNNDDRNYPDFLGDTKDQRSYLHWSALWMCLCHGLMSEGGLILVFSDWRQLPVTTDALQAAGFVWRGIVVWDKGGGARPRKGGFRSQAEFVVWGSKGALTGDRYASGVFRVSPLAGGKLHQVGKPLPLMEGLMEACGRRGSRRPCRFPIWSLTPSACCAKRRKSTRRRCSGGIDSTGPLKPAASRRAP